MANSQRSLKKSDAAVSNEKIVAWLHWLSAFLLAAAFAWGLVAVFAPANFANWPEAALILLAAISTIAALARQLPLQNVLLAAFVIAVFGGAAHAVGALTGIPFGPFTFTENAGPEIFKTLPWAMPLLWVVAGFEFAWHGAADFASVAKNQILRFLGHRFGGGFGRVV